MGCRKNRSRQKEKRNRKQKRERDRKREREREREREDTHHLQQGQVACAHIVKVDLDILPPDLCVVVIDEGKALGLVVDHFVGEHLLRRLVEAVVILSGEEVDPHDTENQPKDEAHQQHIHNGGDGSHQRVDYHLDQSGGEGGGRMRQRAYKSMNTQLGHHQPNTPTLQNHHCILPRYPAERCCVSLGSDTS